MAEVADKVVDDKVDDKAVDKVADKPVDKATVITDKAVDKAVDKPVAPLWGENWRKQIAGEDEKEQRILERFADPSAVYKSFRALQQKLSSGELKANVPFPEKGTDAEKASWRQDAGLPEAPEKYDLKFDNGLVVGEKDKPIVDDFLKSAFERNVPPNAVKASVEWYFKTLEKKQADQQKADEDFRRASDDTLRAEWGNDYRKNVNMVKALVDTAPSEIKDELMWARLANGKPLMSDVNALRWLTGLARTINPVTTVVPGGDTAAMASAVEDEIKVIETTMRKDRKAYNADAKMQERYRELLGARDSLKKQK